MKHLLSLSFMIFLSVGNVIYGQEGYRQVWADEFEYSGAPDTTSWDYEIKESGWVNNELQNYTNSPENSFVRDGKLTIRAIKTNDIWYSARLVTKNKVDFLYGRMEIRAKLPPGKGTWPAIWLFPTDRQYGGWPECGEIDIMEHVGYDPGVIHATVHTKAYNHLIKTQVGKSTLVPDFADQFHTYIIEWDADKIDIYIDDLKYFTFNNDQKNDFTTWPFNKRFHLIMNIAIGGDWGGSKGIDPNLTVATMEVEYVRLFAKKPDTKQEPIR